MKTDCVKNEFKGECCCSCRYHLEDFHHCTTMLDRPTPGFCVCNQHKGWICSVEANYNGHYHSGWSEHGLCEMWTKNIDLRLTSR